jgi:hypothetical protein
VILAVAIHWIERKVLGRSLMRKTKRSQCHTTSSRLGLWNWPAPADCGIAAKSAAFGGTPAVTAASSARRHLPSRPREFHPEPLTDPDVILSHHPARATARRLPPSAEHSGFSRFDAVGPRSTAMTCPLCSAGITPLQRYYGAVRPFPAHRYFRPRGWRRLCLFP